MRSVLALATSTLFLVGLLAGPAGAQGLTLVQRFGPDGLPFTYDDPLAPGGSASGARFAAMAGDSCSEVHPHAAHDHNGGHPNPSEVKTDEGLSQANNHKGRQPPDLVTPDDPGSNLVLDAPFDWTVWVAGMNLDDAQMTRHRAFPTDDHWTDPDTEMNHDFRGWVTTGWTPGEEDKMGDVFQPGARIKDLHVDALGLSIRDVKPKMGWGIGVQWETLDYFEFGEMKDKFDPQYGARLDFMGQQAFVQAWVSELVNLNTHENGISGNFVVDISGSQPLGTMGFEKCKMGCCFELRDLPVELGGYAGEFPQDVSMEQLVMEVPRPYYNNKPQFDYVFDTGSLNGTVMLFIPCEAIRGIAKGMAASEARKKMKELDEIISLVPDDDWANIGLYSGLAGREAKNPNDKLLLAMLEKGGQFKPVYWLKWIYIGGDPVGQLGFSESEFGQQLGEVIEQQDDLEITSTMDVFGDQGTGSGKWRYNHGNTFMAKSMMLFGTSDAERGQPPGNVAVPLDQRMKTPDLLETVAKNWLYVQMDVIDPLKAPEDRGLAVWRNFDALIGHEDPAGGDGPKPTVVVDWPPPNFSFGAAQISAFRSASGGVITQSGYGVEPLDARNKHSSREPTLVDPSQGTLALGLVSIDPDTMTFSLAGGIIGEGAIEYAPTRRPELVDAGVLHFSWSKPQPLTTLPGHLDQDGGLRWLQAAVNHYREGDAVVKWMWDFERDGSVDSEHAQQMADIGSSEMAAAFAYQESANGGGRTGFTLVRKGQR